MRIPRDTIAHDTVRAAGPARAVSAPLGSEIARGLKSAGESGALVTSRSDSDLNRTIQDGSLSASCSGLFLLLGENQVDFARRVHMSTRCISSMHTPSLDLRWIGSSREGFIALATCGNSTVEMSEQRMTILTLVLKSFAPNIFANLKCWFCNKKTRN